MDQVDVEALQQLAPGGEHVLVHAFDPGHELVEVARRARLADPVDPHPGAHLLARVALTAAGEDVHHDALAHELLGQLAHVTGEATLHDGRVLPGQDQDALTHGGARDPTPRAAS